VYEAAFKTVSAGLGKDHIAGLQAIRGAMIEIEPAIAGEHVGSAFEAQQSGGPVNPFGSSFQFEKIADRRFIECDDAIVAQRGLLEFGAVFFIAEGGFVAESAQNLIEGWQGADGGFEFGANFMRAWDAGALPGDDGFGADLTEAQQILGALELEVGSVVECVGFEAARDGNGEFGVGEAKLGGNGIGKADFHFGFDTVGSGHYLEFRTTKPEGA